MSVDVPSPIDFQRPDDAREWADTAMVKRPWRTTFFDRFVVEIQSRRTSIHHVLELGSGPGFLARHVLSHEPGLSYTALDFSSAMHQLASERLAALAESVQFVERSFKAPDWAAGLAPADAVVTMQAVHELRHKRHAAGLHAQVRQLLAPGGLYLVCDHFAGQGGMANHELYMTVDEQCHALLAAGFQRVDRLLLQDGLVLHLAV